MKDKHNPEDRTQGTGIINTDECVRILREIITQADGGTVLRRSRVYFKDEGYERGDSFLQPQAVSVKAELIEQGIIALGLPAPQHPHPIKKQSVPTEAQAKILEAMKGGRVLHSQRNWGFSIGMRRWVMQEGGISLPVSDQTFNVLEQLDWIQRMQGTSRDTEHVITEKGKEALARFKPKKSAIEEIAKVG